MLGILEDVTQQIWKAPGWERLNQRISQVAEPKRKAYVRLHRSAVREWQKTYWVRQAITLIWVYVMSISLTHTFRAGIEI